MCLATTRLSSGIIAFALLLMLCAHIGLAQAASSWSDLSIKQQELLLPLKEEWETMSDAQRDRWLRVGAKYENEPAQRQVVMRERIRVWSELHPRERAAIRENYKALQDKQPQGELSSSWNSYRNLDQKERNELKGKNNK